MKRQTTYLAVQPKKHITHLRVDVYYALGGYNNFTGKQEGRGFYLSVSPVGCSKGNGFVSETYGAFSGVKQLILPVSRYSDKRMTEAVRLAGELQPQLVAHVLEKQELVLAA